MKLAYIVLCHKRPDQVARLVSRIADVDSRVWIHIDARSDETTHALRAEFAHSETVSFTKQVRVYWSTWSMVRATLIALRAIVGGGWPFEYVFLLSGQDYPVVGSSQVRQRLEAAGGRSLIDCRDLEATWPLAFDRTVRRNVIVRGRGLVRLDSLPARQPPRGTRLYGGSSWWALSRSCVDYVLGSRSPARAIARYMRSSECPEEAFFQTALMNSPYATSVENWCPTYVDWRPSDLKHPATLTSEDFDSIVGSGCLFARKFDVSVDAQILDMLDEHAARGEFDH